MPAHIEIKQELDLGEPSQELLDWAKENINEDPDTKCQVIDELKELIYCKLPLLISCSALLFNLII